MNFVMTEETLRENFAHNLSSYRRRAGMTQLELAQKLNYSDKSISKWERGDGLPDLPMVMTIAELFGVTVNDMISGKEVKKPFLFHNKFVVTLLSVGIVWLVATIAFLFLVLFVPGSFRPWLFFIYAIPVSGIVFLVLSNCWWNKICSFIATSIIVWSVPLGIVLTAYNVHLIGLIFIISAIIQILIVFGFLIRKTDKHK